MMRKTHILFPFLCLVWASCSSGSAEREQPKGGPIRPVGEDQDLDLTDPDAGPSRSHNLALDNLPTEEPVSDIPKDLRCAAELGGKVLHRLNRAEYNNTVRDLLGFDENIADSFPKDDFGDSFDNNARALSVNPLLTEGYIGAAEKISAWALSAENPDRDGILVCRPKNVGADNCAREILTGFLYRAFRRPLFDHEIAAYVQLVDRARELGATFEQGIQTAVQAALLSTNFLYKVELDVDPDSEEAHAVSPFELATRLSYFLWSSMPDEELFQAAESGKLKTAKQIRGQVERMLADDRAGALLDNFVERWFETDDIAESNEPAAELFPTYTPELKAAMEAETRRFMRNIISGKLPFDEMLTSDVSYINAELAEHYGVEGDFDSSLKKTSLAGTERAGLLTQASILTLTGAPTRTSPVRRGVYVLSNLLCDAPPPPPANVEGGLDDPPQEMESVTDRTRAHTEKPECAGCHQLMDPIGFGLENFDAIGRYRTEDNGVSLDPSGELVVDGESVAFESVAQLSEILTQDPRLVRCATRKLLTYALGRLLVDKKADDRCSIDSLSEVLVEEQSFPELIQSVTLTESFRGRRGGLGSMKEEK